MLFEVADRKLSPCNDLMTAVVKDRSKLDPSHRTGSLVRHAEPDHAPHNPDFPVIAR